MIGNDIPEGQGSVTALLAECFDLAYELRTEAEDNQESNDEQGSTTNGVGVGTKG